MDDSLYAPPKAPLSTKFDVPLTRPPEVGRALVCLWIVFGISAVVALARCFMWGFAPDGVEFNRLQQDMVHDLVALGLYLLVNWMLATGQSLGRTLLFVGIGISVVNGVAGILLFLGNPAILTLFSIADIVTLGFRLYAGYFLISGPAGRWFGAAKQRKGLRERQDTTFEATAAQIEFGAVPARPVEVNRAVICLWVILGASVALAIWLATIYLLQVRATHAPASAWLQPFLFMLVGFALAFLIAYWWYRAIGNGGHWARIVFLANSLVLLLHALVALYAVLVAGATMSPEQIVLTLVFYGTHFCAAGLLLTRPAREWFRKMKGR